MRVSGTVFEIARGSQTSQSLSNVDRGTHTVSARVVDSNGTTLIDAAPVVFHMQRVSVSNNTSG